MGIFDKFKVGFKKSASALIWNKRNNNKKRNR